MEEVILLPLPPTNRAWRVELVAAQDLTKWQKMRSDWADGLDGMGLERVGTLFRPNNTKKMFLTPDQFPPR